ncbi:MAG: SusC/RagA family TonB-linked outer membrane protein [Bacteroidota bacterium]
MRQRYSVRATCAVALFLLGTLSASAQSVNGTVTDADTGEPLPGVNILVQGTTVGTTTDLNGRYDLELPSGNRGLLFSFVGYRDFEVVLPPGVTAFDVEMEEDPLGLDEVVVTGLATSVKRSNLANSVGTVSAEELVPAPAQTLERALSGKIAGISISQNTGAPGGGINVNLRGTSTITGDTQPLYVIDGVIIDNSAIEPGLDIVTAATGAGSARPQGQPTNRIADLNPNDIESIEVLKGASAAAIYGAKATNGVVLITTKRGRPGETRISLSQQVGFTSILNKIGTRQFTAETAEALVEGGGDLLAQNGQLDYEDLIYGETGLLSETNIGISGGDQNTRFFVSGLALNEDGIVDNTGYDKYSARVNVEQRFSDRIRFNVNTSISRSTSDRSITGNENQGSTTLGFAQVFTPPFIDLRETDGVFPSGPAGANPLQTVALLQNEETSNRGIGSVFLGLNLLRVQNQTLDFNVQGGADYYTLENDILSPPELQFEQAKDLPGLSVKGRTTSLNTNLGLSLVHFYSTPSQITFNTSAGYQYETRDLNNILSQAQGIVETQSNLDQSATVSILENRLIQRERGFFLQEEVNFRDQVILTGGFRADASSRNGDTEQFFFYPKISAALRLSQFDFWQPLGGLANDFKLRAAFGRTGNLPLARAKFTSLIPENVAGTGGVLSPTRRGNPDIEPEQAQEFEVGADATLFDDRASVEFSYYTQNITDLILQNALPPSSGFTSEFINAGDMTTQGIEAALTATPVDGAVTWSTRFNFFTSSSEITSLDVDPFEIGGFALSLGQFRIEEGVSPNEITGLDEDGNQVFLGNENPDFQLAWNNDISFNRFSLGFLWDWKQGGDVINLGKFLSDLGGTTEDLDTQEGQDRLAGVGGTGRYVEDGTYLKLREASLTYDVDPDVVARWTSGQARSLTFGISGRNLLMFTGYDGYDPEVSQFGNVAIGRSVDVLPFPSARSFYFKVAVGL